MKTFECDREKAYSGTGQEKELDMTNSSDGNEERHTRVGVGVLVLKDGKALLGKRKNAHGEGQYCWPGGHLEYMESICECGR